MSHPDFENIGTPETLVIEECSELIVELGRLTQALCKVDRFGYFNRYPKDAPTNMQNVLSAISAVDRELEDVDKAMSKLKLRMQELCRLEEEG